MTAIQTIVDVLKIERERNHLPEMEYLERIEHSVERMDQMISEMLHEGSMVPISTETIVNIVLAQCSATEYASYLCVENSVPTEAIIANRILLPRAIINLLKTPHMLSVTKAPHPFGSSWTKRKVTYVLP